LDDLNLTISSRRIRASVSLPIQILETLPLLQLRVQGKDWHLQYFKERHESSDTVDGTDEDQ